MITSRLRRNYARLIRSVVGSWTFRESLRTDLSDLFEKSPNLYVPRPTLAPIPSSYDLPGASTTSPNSRQAVFITARFRSGSTFLWNIFRNTPGITAYYEPLHAQKWRNVQSADPGRPSVKLGHVGVQSYDDEFAGKEAAGKLFDPAWAERRLYLTPMHHEPGLRAYIQALIDMADHRPVLQFNRVDFRLPWLKANFPGVPIVHLYRHPREQWMSMIETGGTPPGPEAKPPFDAYKLFYTLEFCRDLQAVFPFLDPNRARHPYDLAYYLWRLSYSLGVANADINIAYETLQSDFQATVESMMTQLKIDADPAALVQLNRGRDRMRWPDYAPADWFAEREAECDRVLDRFFRAPADLE